MDFDAYARTAVDIANAPLESMPGLVALFAPGTWERSEATERDLIVMRRAQRRLRDVFRYGVAGRDVEAVNALNALLEAYPMQPRIAAHDRSDWHLHVSGRGSSPSAEYVAGAVWGLAVWLCQHGSSRFGLCADQRCGNVYLDTSSNSCRRFCSERCATRSHVAAHRARKRAAGGADQPDASQADASQADASQADASQADAPVAVEPAGVEPAGVEPDPVDADAAVTRRPKSSRDLVSALTRPT